MATEMIVIFHEDERGIARTWSEVGEIVRCKNCKRHNAKAGKLYRCDLLNAWHDGDFFCADGERSEE